MRDYIMSIRTKRTITKIGNSAGITLPAEVLAKLGVTSGDKVHLVEMDGGNFMITAYDLCSLDVFWVEWLSINL